jgi:hypothetical protein
MEEQLKCMNCGKDVSANNAHLFAQVYLCHACNEMAVSFYRRCETELKHLLVLTKESIRESLIKGKFFPAEQDKREIPKAEILKQILKMNEETDANKLKHTVR